MDNNYLSVTELNTYLKQIVDSEELLHRICVVGEISGLSQRGPHAYFTLKDANAALRCCCFNCAKTYLPKDGELVLIYGSVDFYHKGGYLSFNAIRIEPYGQGLLALKLEELKKKLASLGYFDDARKKPIPAFCLNIAVITSKDGAVLQDIKRTIRRKNYVSNIDFFDVKVQGIGSVSSIITSLERVDKLKYDVIIIARGGGSQEDLMGFNDERLVYAIADCKTPIVSAVGHETDVTLCDFASDLRVPTPTAAGELFAYDIAQYIEMLKSNLAYAFDGIKAKYELLMTNYKLIYNNLISAAMDRQKDMYGDIRMIAKELIHSISEKYNDVNNSVVSSLKVINACNPATILESGFAEITDAKGNKVTSFKALNVGDTVNLKGKDGNAKAQILEISED